MKKLIALLTTAVLFLAPAAAFAENAEETTAAEMPEITETEETEASTELDTVEIPTEAEGAVAEEEQTDETPEEPTEAPAEIPAPAVNIPKEITVTYDGIRVDLYPAPYIDDGITMVPIRALAKHIGFDVRYDADYNTEVLSLGLNYIFFNVNTNYTTAFGTDLYALKPTVQKDGTVFVAIRTFADIIG
ncbi:MAG: hypothetical protein IJH94_00480, partial [Clostridia bacterium]|nr:hypothetical protein [Clostridia bacterium]